MGQFEFHGQYFPRGPGFGRVSFIIRTMSSTSHKRSVTPAAMAGVIPSQVLQFGITSSNVSRIGLAGHIPFPNPGAFAGTIARVRGVPACVPIQFDEHSIVYIPAKGSFHGFQICLESITR